MGDVLNGIDFDQLKIENRQFLDKIELKNRELLRLKLTAGKTVHTLNHYKKRLQDVLEDNIWLDSEIDIRSQSYIKLTNELNVADKEHEKSIFLKTGLLRSQDNYSTPSVVHYVSSQASVDSLSKKVRDWKRKCEIASLAS
eukprot:TRINITY_DN948_c0_g1_i1.p1 TRINITY_DN948_c0_g1~~TRINITY_DN948_c0_g1_i1.p1  ORF type:complete len:141 (-),score=6.49 TRINITY_DN948_c0_g1_i1:29-451(-)